MREADIDPAVLNTPDVRINISKYRRALSIAAAHTETPTFGLQLSQRQSLEKLGPVGYLVRHAPKLGTALTELTQYLHIHDSGSHTYLEYDGDIAYLGLRPHGVSGESTVQQCELALGLILKFFRTVVSDSWTADAVHFEHKRPSNVRNYERLFRCPLLFEQPLTALEFPKSLLSVDLKTSDPGLFSILHNYLERLDAEAGNDILAQVSRSIHRQYEYGPPRLDQTAAALGLTRHALQRRLRAKGTSFQKLQKNVRHQIAQRYLRDTDLSLIEISSILALSEPSVFTRTFQKEAGVTPSEWRRQNRTD